MLKQNGTNCELYLSVTHYIKSWIPFNYSSSLRVYWLSYHLQV